MDGGKVTGAGRYAPGKKVTLKATATKGFVFGGWYSVGNGEWGTGNGDDDGLISQAASYSFEMGEEDIDLYARFVTSDADKGSIAATFNGAACRVTLYAPPKPTAKPPFKGFCKTFAVTLTLDEQKIVINAVLVDEILDDWLNGNPDGEGDEDFYGPSQGNGDCQSECD